MANFKSAAAAMLIFRVATGARPQPAVHTIRAHKATSGAGTPACRVHTRVDTLGWYRINDNAI
jgi:hypothetical protein